MRLKFLLSNYEGFLMPRMNTYVHSLEARESEMLERKIEFYSVEKVG